MHKELLLHHPTIQLMWERLEGYYGCTRRRIIELQPNAVGVGLQYACMVQKQQNAQKKHIKHHTTYPKPIHIAIKQNLCIIRYQYFETIPQISMSYICRSNVNAKVVENILCLDLHRNRGIIVRLQKDRVDTFSIGIILEDTMIYWLSAASGGLVMSI